MWFLKKFERVYEPTSFPDVGIPRCMGVFVFLFVCVLVVMGACVCIQFCARITQQCIYKCLYATWSYVGATRGQLKRGMN